MQSILNFVGSNVVQVQEIKYLQCVHAHILARMHSHRVSHFFLPFFFFFLLFISLLSKPPVLVFDTDGQLPNFLSNLNVAYSRQTIDFDVYDKKRALSGHHVCCVHYLPYLKRGLFSTLQQVEVLPSP